MTRAFRLSTPVMAVALIGFWWGGVYVAHANGYFINVTDSAPIGLWHRQQIATTEQLNVGDWVVVCPNLNVDQVKDLYSHTWLRRCDEIRCECRPVLKQVAAVKGDVVSVDAQGVVSVNGIVVRALAARPDGQSVNTRLDSGNHPTKEGQFWVLNDHEWSVDSRYYGVLNGTELEAHARPIAVFEG